MSFAHDPPLDLLLLGGCRLSIGGHDAGLRYDKVRTLLALLAMADGTPLRREYLAAMLWPDANSEAGRRSLRHALHVLRDALGPAAARLQCNRQTAWLSLEGAGCDALELKAVHHRCCVRTDAQADTAALEQAAGLFAGTFLAGIDADSGSALESWLRDQRDAAAARAADLWRELVRLRLAGGMAREALAAARQQLDLDACDERANLLCMEALAAAHGADAALAHYAGFRRRLESEWGVMPSAIAEAFAARLRDRQAEPPAPPERRPVTVVCLQQAGQGDEAEDSGNPAFAELVDAIRQRIGDGSARLVVPHHGLVFVYFGIPLAREDSALAAVRLAIDLAGRSRPEDGFVQAIHSGLPTLTGAASSDTADAGLGTLANAALRLCAFGRAGDILASGEAVHWLRRDLHRRGGENFRLIPHPEHADLVLIRSQARRAGPKGDDPELPLIGRRAELAALLRAVRRTPGSLALVGEAGLGKTRLALEAARRAKQHGQTVWLRCNREAMTEPLAPLRDWIGALAGIAPGEPAQRSARKLARLDRRLGTHGLLARLFASGADEEHGAVSMKSRLANLLALAAEQKERSGARLLLVVVDDIQWAGQSMRELLEQWLRVAPGHVFTLLLARSEEDIPSGVPAMPLPRLDELHARMLLDQVQPERPLVQREADAGLRLAEGLPLFLIEFKRHYSGHGRRELALPRSLHDLLSARLEALSAKLRRLAGCAAILGNDGGLAELSRLVDTTPSQLAPQLALLAEAGLLYPPAHGRYRFRHQALQRAALERLPRSERRALHALAAHSLSEHLPPARIARHWEEAEQPGNALPAHLAAGEQALAEGAQREAASHFDSVLELGSLHGAEMAALFSAWLGKGLAITVLEGYGSASAHACFAAALDLALRLDDPQRRLQACWGIWLSSSERVGFKGALQEALPLLELAQSHGDDAWICLGHYAVGNNLFWQGRIADAEVHLFRCADLADRPGVRRRIVAMVGEASDLYALGFLAWAAVKRGDLPAAAYSLQRAQAAADVLNNPPSSALVLGLTALAAQMAGEPERARQWAARTVAIADPRGYELWLAVALLVDTWACARLGETADLAGLEAALTGVGAAMPSVLTIFLAPYMDALERLGRYADALAVFDQAMTIVRRYRGRHELDTLWFLRAACLDRLPGCAAEAARSRQRAQRIRACLFAPVRQGR